MTFSQNYLLMCRYGRVSVTFMHLEEVRTFANLCMQVSGDAPRIFVITVN